MPSCARACTDGEPHGRIAVCTQFAEARHRLLQLEPAAERHDGARAPCDSGDRGGCAAPRRCAADGQPVRHALEQLAQRRATRARGGSSAPARAPSARSSRSTSATSSSPASAGASSSDCSSWRTIAGSLSLVYERHRAGRGARPGGAVRAERAACARGAHRAAVRKSPGVEEVGEECSRIAEDLVPDRPVGLELEEVEEHVERGRAGRRGVYSSSQLRATWLISASSRK